MSANTRPNGLQFDRAANGMFWALVSSGIIGVLAVTTQSLWVDEANTAFKASQPSFHQWWATMEHEKGSDLQMPLYMFCIWAWEKLFGATEYALRAFNIPWFVIGTAAMAWGFRQDRHLRWSMLLLTFTNALVWYYLSEARPYIVLFACAGLTTACLLRLFLDQTSSDSPVWFRIFCGGLLGLCSANLIAVPWAMGAILAASAALGLRRTCAIFRRFRYSAGFTVLILTALAGYYIWTLRVGAGASQIAGTGPRNVAFIFYELSGLSGLGPGRFDLRAQGIAACRSFLPMLALGVFLVSALIYSALVSVAPKTNRRNLALFASATLLPFFIVLLLGHFAHMRLLGRHFIPLLPFILVFFAIGFRRLFFSDRMWLRGVAVAAAVTLLVSALQIRFAPRHQRDDYRSATQLANHSLSTGDNVWWLADETTAAYYHLEVDVPNLSLGRNLDAAAIQNGTDVIFLSKRDIYDPTCKIDNYIRQHHFTVTRTLPAFQIFEPSVR